MATKTADEAASPSVSIVMGSKSDLDVFSAATEILEEFGVTYEVRVISAHRTPDKTVEYAATVERRGVEVVIAGAGGAAALPGVVAAKTLLPVLGVPIDATSLQGMDALLSIVQMPRGVPVGTLAVGKWGAANAALLAIAILGGKRPELREKLRAWRAKREADALKETFA